VYVDWLPLVLIAGAGGALPSLVARRFHEVPLRFGQWALCGVGVAWVLGTILAPAYPALRGALLAWEMLAVIFGCGDLRRALKRCRGRFTADNPNPPAASEPPGRPCVGRGAGDFFSRLILL
jgi:hypothetical protein